MADAVSHCCLGWLNSARARVDASTHVRDGQHGLRSSQVEESAHVAGSSEVGTGGWGRCAGRDGCAGGLQDEDLHSRKLDNNNNNNNNNDAVYNLLKRF